MHGEKKVDTVILSKHMKNESMKDEDRGGRCSGCSAGSACRWSSWHIFGALLWTAAAVSLAAAWVAARGTPVMGYDAGFWFGSAMSFGILALPLKMKRCNSGC